KRFEEAAKDREAIREQMDKNHAEVMTVLSEIRSQFGRPFEQFARNVVIRILEGEGITGVRLKGLVLPDPDGLVFPESKQVEIDGYSESPPVIVEVTTILKSKEKIDKFIRKKEFVEKTFGKKYRGFFVASGSELTAEELANISVLLRKHGSELINL
ncbi:MAG: hypothetical protein ACTSWN_04610, partial [Promethearchaeota archaeon]